MHTLQKAIESLTGEKDKGPITRQTGCPISNNFRSLTAGPNGPVMLQDVDLLEKLSQFTREKIPARNVHALGCGAYGVLTITNDITKYTKAKVFSSVGKQTKFFSRLSGIFTEQGDPETNRDPRGFALKFYTEDGNWDLLAINTPVFNVRDGKVGPDAVHALKRDPRTGSWYPTQTWDYVVNHPEAVHQTLMLFSDRGGTPLSFRYMHAYGCNTFSFINANNERFWVKFHMNAVLGSKGLSVYHAKLLAGEDPNFLSRDLREAIERGDYPKWKFQCQIMPEAEGYRNPHTFDCTKVWKHDEYPLIDIGEIELNQNPVDYFSEVEQVAFSPANVVPGIGFSPDKLLQARLLIYDDAQHHRLGPNFKQLPINTPKEAKARCNYTGGQGQLTIEDKFPHYYPNSFGGYQAEEGSAEPPLKCDGPVGYYAYPNEGTYDDYYKQANEFFNLLIEEDRMHLIENIAISLEKVKPEIVQKVIVQLNNVDTRLGKSVERLLKEKSTGTVTRTEGELLLMQLDKFLKGNKASTTQ